MSFSRYWYVRRPAPGMPSRFIRLPAYVSASSTCTWAVGQRESARRAKFEPMKPAPPVTSRRAPARVAAPLAILAAPVVRNVVVVRRDAELVRLVVVIRVGRRVDEHAAHGLHALHAVRPAGRDAQEDGVLLAHEELVHLALRRRGLAHVVEHDLHHAR